VASPSASLRLREGRACDEESYIEQIMFGGIGMDDKRVMVRLNSADAKTALFKVFVDAINKLSVIEEVVRPAGEVILVSEANPFPTTRPCVVAKKTVFDKVPCDSDLEREFTQWLDDGAEDVLAFAKNEIAVHFDMEYVSEKGGLRSYRPDFVVRTPEGSYIVETKGWEDLEVARKDMRASQWCRGCNRVVRSALAIPEGEGVYVSGPQLALLRRAGGCELAQLAENACHGCHHNNHS
jgi:type III restriction enzyme